MLENSTINFILNDSSNDEKVKWIIELQYLNILLFCRIEGGSPELEEQIEVYKEAFPTLTSNVTELFNNFLNHVNETFENQFKDINRNFFNIYLIEILNYSLKKKLSIKNNDAFLLLNRQLLTNQISSQDYIQSLAKINGNDIGFSRDQVRDIQMGYKRLKNYFNGIISNTYYYEYISQKSECCSFCNTMNGKYFSAAEILTLKNENHMPVFIFVGGQGCTGFFEADPFYEQKD
jgi:hypothetical protein